MQVLLKQVISIGAALDQYHDGVDEIEWQKPYPGKKHTPPAATAGTCVRSNPSSSRPPSCILPPQQLIFQSVKLIVLPRDEGRMHQRRPSYLPACIRFPALCKAYTDNSRLCQSHLHALLFPTSNSCCANLSQDSFIIFCPGPVWIYFRRPGCARNIAIVYVLFQWQIFMLATLPHADAPLLNKASILHCLLDPLCFRRFTSEVGGERHCVEAGLSKSSQPV